tara:strand:+ start:2643 stop:2816 length:174 start_codon:yes stop_codon:yes gene_type:complete
MTHSNKLTRDNAQEVFELGIEQMKKWYMLMDIDDKYYYFKHKLTRQYMKIEREGENK